MNRDDEEQILLKVSQVCKKLQRCKARVYQMIRTKELAHIRDGRSIRIPREALDDWIRKKRRQTGC